VAEVSSLEGYEIGLRVRTARKAMKLRQADLSEMTGLPASHLSDIERGALMPTIPTLRKISEALDRPLEYFLQEGPGGPRSMGMVINFSSIGGQAAARFSELVEERTEGELKVRVYYHSALGTAWEQVEGLAEGAIGIYIDEMLSFERYAEICGPVFLPYFFRDRQHYYRFLQSEIFEEHIYRKLLDNGIRLLNPVSNWECGSFEVLMSTKPTFVAEDLVGRKFRSYTSEAAIALRRALGAEPVVVEWARAEEAFAQGLVDTFLAPAAYFESLQLNKLAGYATLLTYGYTLNLTVAVSEREYRKLPPYIQEALIEAVQEAGDFCTRLANQQTVIDLEQLSTEHGLPVIHPDQQAWRRRFSAAIRQICDDGLLPHHLYQEMQGI
jgi:TRAP-type C4-dicarboxylate transport system substrate-binding protein